MKRVSVIIPVYKVENYIEDTVKSVIAQTYPDWELLIIDDESPDRSIEICQQFDDPRIKIIHQKNQGLAGARNTGIRHATGEYLAFLDGDDLWEPKKLEKHVDHLETSPTVGVSFSRSAFIDEAGNALNLYQMPKLKDITKADILCRNPIGNGSAAVFRRETLDEIKFQDEVEGEIVDCYFDNRFRLSQDVECWLRIAIQTSWVIKGIPEALTLYRVNSGGLSADLLSKMKSWDAMISKLRPYDPELFAEYEGLSKAYFLRYLARRAITLNDGQAAVDLFHRAIAFDWRMTLYEPRRTVLTGAASYLLWLLPNRVYQHIHQQMMQITGASQKNRIMREQRR
jgi:glycosyltransferase involved in cell wall biosynthesis